MVWLFRTYNIVPNLRWYKLVILVVYHAMVDREVVIEVVMLNKILQRGKNRLPTTL